MLAVDWSRVCSTAVTTCGSWSATRPGSPADRGPVRSRSSAAMSRTRRPWPRARGRGGRLLPDPSDGQRPRLRPPRPCRRHRTSSPRPVIFVESSTSGGLLPEGDHLSDHLASRAEVGRDPARRAPHRRVSRRAGDRFGIGVIRDGPLSHRAAPRDGGAQVDSQRCPADRGPRYPRSTCCLPSTVSRPVSSTSAPNP